MSTVDRHRFYSAGLDVSSRAGFLLGSFLTGLSFQPNLLSRGTRDQAIINGVAAGAGYAWGTTAHSFLRSTADRLPAAGRSPAARVAAGATIDALAVLVGTGIQRAVPPREHESSRRALVRLGAVGLTAAGAAGLGADLLEPTRGRAGFHAVGLLAAAGATVGGYLLTKPGRSTAGSVGPDGTDAHEDVVRSVSGPKALASGLAVTGILFGVARAESAVSSAVARGAAVVLGGSPDDHRAVGRLAAAAALGAVGWGAVAAASTLLTRAGTGLEAAHEDPPTVPEVTGGPGSLVRWADQTRESRRWLTMTLAPGAIEEVMGEPARQPVRVYAPLEAGTSAEERAELLLAEIDRTGALDRPVFALFSPTGSGYVNYVATETLEYLTRGACASAAIQYSVLPSALSLTKVELATHQTRMVMNGLVARLLERSPERRPRLVMFGESLGSQVSEEMFRGTGVTGLEGVALDAALWIGTPASTVWRKELWGTRTVAEPPEVGPGRTYLPRAVRDWRALPDEDRARVRFLLLQNGDDPVPKFEPPLVWRRPDWLGPDDLRPPGAPRGTRWLPVVTFVTTFIDLQNALVPTPGIFQEGGHDYRREIPEAMRQVLGLTATDEQMDRVQQALRERELRWEVRRRWAAAEATATTHRAAAEDKVLRDVSQWVGRPVDREEIRRITA
ncbi:MAG: alpha/beta-hydrolase family protein [Candidatus Nanopelagicales bacterium]